MAEKNPRLLVGISERLEKMLGGENVYLLVLAAIVGILGGFGAVLFREMIELFRSFAFPGGSTLADLGNTPWYWKVIPPAVGGLIVGPLVYFFAREAKGHGIPEVMTAVSNNGGRIRKRVMAVKVLASAITIGTGGSVGREGPIGQIGAGLGSSIGQLLGFEGNRLVVLLGCGAAAGMAATFNAPIGGVILAVEVIIGSASVSIFSPLVVASVMGTIVSRMWFGDEPAFLDVPEYTLVSPVEVPLYVVLGIVAGLVALLFTRGICLIEDLWEKMPTPEWLNAVLGGAMIGGIAIYFPHVLGVGYETIDIPLQGKGTVGLLLALVFVKIFATGTTLGSGGSGGVFAPSLFVGACLGGAFGMIVGQLFPDHTAHPGAYALVGMGALVAGTTHAPITAIIMLFELTGDYAIILPLMLSCIISVVLASKVMPASIYTIKLLRRGERLRSSSEAELMRATKVRRILRPFPETMGPETPMKEVIRRALSGTLAHQYVVNEESKLLGVITLHHLKTLFMEQDLDENLLVAADVMRSPVVSVRLDDTLDVAMSHITRLDTEMLPVVNRKDHITGCVTRHDMVVFFEHEILMDKNLGLKFIPKDSPDDADFVEVPEGHVVESIAVTRFLNGQTLRQLDLRATAGLNVLGIRRNTPEGIERLAPDPGRPLREGEWLITVGERAAVASFKKAIN
ncbi:MAG: CBS domain-containing protein [Deltaproteobacteria bacterium]|nr:CBS domain-containing protein [Deltaproteobacteria bacterium]